MVSGWLNCISKSDNNENDIGEIDGVVVVQSEQSSSIVVVLGLLHGKLLAVDGVHRSLTVLLCFSMKSIELVQCNLELM